MTNDINVASLRRLTHEVSRLRVAVIGHTNVVLDRLNACRNACTIHRALQRSRMVGAVLSCIPAGYRAVHCASCCEQKWTQRGKVIGWTKRSRSSRSQGSTMLIRGATLSWTKSLTQDSQGPLGRTWGRRPRAPSPVQSSSLARGRKLYRASELTRSNTSKCTFGHTIDAGASRLA